MGALAVTGMPVAGGQAVTSLKTFDVSAIDVDITLNRFGDHDPEGNKMYVLAEDAAPVFAEVKPPLSCWSFALTLERRCGQTSPTICRWRALPSTSPSWDTPPTLRVPRLASTTTPPWRLAIPSPSGSSSMPTRNHARSPSPILATPSKGPLSGLYGVFIVTPAGSTFHDP